MSRRGRARARGRSSPSTRPSGIVVTTDGRDLRRSRARSYVPSRRSRVVRELQRDRQALSGAGANSRRPGRAKRRASHVAARIWKSSLGCAGDVPSNCLTAGLGDDIAGWHPARGAVRVPCVASWACAPSQLAGCSWARTPICKASGIMQAIAGAVQDISRVRDAFGVMDAISEREEVASAGVTAIDMGTGRDHRRNEFAAFALLRHHKRAVRL